MVPDLSFGQVFGLFLLAVFAVMYARWDLKRHPSAPCSKCGGSGKHWSVTGLRFGKCRRCGGSGSKRGFLPRLFGIGD